MLPLILLYVSDLGVQYARFIYFALTRRAPDA
jgi:hypothetical protein